MTAPTLDFSVVICAYTEDRWDDLVAAVQSVQHQTAAPREVILAVDHNPALRDRARALLGEVVVTENAEARGLSGARNSGVALARGAVIAFLDDDAIAAPDWLARLRQGYARQDVMGVGGMISPIWSGGRPGWFPEEFLWVVGCTYRGMPQTASPVRNLLGANMSFRREIFDALGGFRTGIGRVGTRPVGCEETELCIRARQRWPQRVLLYEPAAQVLHRVPATRTQWRYFRSRCFAEGLSKALVTRHVGAADGLASEWAHTLRVLPRGVAVAMGEAALRREVSALGRAGAITAGLAAATAGYLTTSLTARLVKTREGRDEPRHSVSAPTP